MERVVVITGASRGIGVAIAKNLAVPNAILVLAARDEDGLNNTASMVRAAGAKAIVVPVDLSLASGREVLFSAAESQGPVEIFINNAGIERPLPLLEQSELDIERQIQLNLHVPILLARHTLRGMVARKRGTIVMMSSLSGKSPTPYNAIYSASKFGLSAFVESVRFELMGTGVHIGTVCPGFVSESGMWKDGGIKAPAMMREVSLNKVVSGVLKVLAGADEVLVTPTPIRPMLAMAQLFPSITPRALRAFGVIDVMKRRAMAERGKKPL